MQKILVVLGIGLLLALFGCTGSKQELKNLPYTTGPSCSTVDDCAVAQEKYWCSNCKIVCNSDELCEFEAIGQQSETQENEPPNATADDAQDSQSGTNIQSCKKNMDCPTGQTCYVNTCVVEECEETSECAAGKYCYNGVCKSQDDLVQDGFACETNASQCARACENCKNGYAECTGLSYGTQGGSQTEVLLCLECLFDSACNEGYKCDRGNTRNCILK